jgi:hypothetical protein
MESESRPDRTVSSSQFPPLLFSFLSLKPADAPSRPRASISSSSHLLSPDPFFLPPQQSVDPTPDCASFPDAPSVTRRFFCRNVLPRLKAQPQPLPSSTDNRLNLVGSDFIICGTHPVLCSRPTRIAAAALLSRRTSVWQSGLSAQLSAAAFNPFVPQQLLLS